MEAVTAKINGEEKPIGLEPFDKEWPVGESAMTENPSPFPRINRFRKFAWDMEFTVDHQRACLVTEAYRENEDKPQIVKCALALKHVLANVPITIYKDELIVGEMAAPIKSAPIFPEFSYNWVMDEMKNHPWKDRLHDNYYITKDAEKKLTALESYWKGNTVEEKIIARLSEDEKKGTNLGRGLYLLNLYMFGGVGHLQANYEKLFALGYDGIRKQVQKKLLSLDPTFPQDLAKRDFYQAELIALDAATKYLKRYAALARDMAKNERDESWKRELLKIADNCDWVSESPPRTFWEALQLWFMATTILLIESNGHSVSFGRFDQYMYPFYRRDIESGETTKEEIQELIEIIFIKDLWWTKLRDRLTVIPNSGRGMGGDSLTVGGVDKDGNDATNDLSYMVLDAHAHTRSGVPWLAVRFHKNTPWEFKVKTINNIRIGTGQPKLFNDEAAIPASLKAGRTLEDSRNYHVVGCVEIDAGGKEYGWHDSAYFNIAKVLELAINDGRCIGCGAHCPKWDDCGGAGKRLGPRTGSLADFKSFDEVKTSYDRQMKYWVDQMIAGTEIMDLVHQQLKPLPYLSLLTDDCIERGLDVTAGGAVYNFTGPQAVGVGTVADGFATIRQLVFEENKATGRDLLDACEKNWNGYEALYALVNSKKVHHYGNDDDYADELAKFGVDTYCKYVEGRPNSRGGTYLPGVYSVSANVGLGLVQWASVDGRKAMEPVSDCLGPVHTQAGSHDIKGPTAIAKSVTKLDHVRAGNGTLLNWKFTPECLKGDVGRDNLISLMDVYFERKGMHSQFNVVSRETLEDALVNPEKYKDLLVRVAGYSAFFVELSKPLQYDILGRTELSM
ncbi:glycyl radical enzyme [Desulfosarcina widdelii]|uniref:Glycyl radical enzyme n=1 Tax=Desulfosarcina widdelii TaxID=947919 RepID=A0A5K7Z606_9BACT|nr:formate C-acetyltransferase/glycerol dehydratase family glycyl radical enzyme [Desulfosarcina widdelii]BBO75091.1 glycyl radical enzyme [Desulfosarcina widdelii]